MCYGLWSKEVMCVTCVGAVLLPVPTSTFCPWLQNIYVMKTDPADGLVRGRRQKTTTSEYTGFTVLCGYTFLYCIYCNIMSSWVLHTAQLSSATLHQANTSPLLIRELTIMLTALAFMTTTLALARIFKTGLDVLWSWSPQHW